MPNRDEWLSQIKSVEREFAVMRIAAERLEQSLQNMSTELPSELVLRDVRQAVSQLQGTYLIRMYAQFEAGARDFWESQRSTQPSMRDLLDSIGAKCTISADWIANAHRVRELRNQNVHRADAIPLELLFTECRRALCQYFSRLPLNWS